MNYGIIGVGPVGLVIASHLKQAGKNVSLYDQDTNRVDNCINSIMKITGKLHAEAHLRNAYSDMSEFLQNDLDIVLICTKTCYSEEILDKLKENPFTQEKTIYVSCQNGLDVEEQIVDRFGSDKALRVVLNFGCNILSKEEVRVNFCFTHVLSFRKDVEVKMIRQIETDMNKARFPIEVKEDFQTEVYKKAILNSSLGSICALTSLTMGEIMEDSNLVIPVQKIVKEGIFVAQKLGLDIKDDFFEYAISYLSQGGKHKPSMLIDIETGLKTENRYLCGKILQHATSLNIDVPVIQTVFYLLDNLERKCYKNI